MMPPNNESVPKLCEEYGISDGTLYTWRKKARESSYTRPANDQPPDKWGSEYKFLIVLETYSMNEAELAEYCRKKGLYQEGTD